MNKIKQKGFTLIELLVVIAIIGLLASLVLVSMNSAREKARDARRLSDVRQIILALTLYYDDHNGNYPQEYQSGAWDRSTGSHFIDDLEDEGYMGSVPVDPINNTNYHYRYHVYNSGTNGCDSSGGEYFVLGITDMETSGRPHPDSPGWSCASRNWQNEFDWVIGGFES